MKLDSLPDAGRLVVGHPSNEKTVRKLAEREECDYWLSPHVPERQVYELDIDKMFRFIDGGL